MIVPLEAYSHPQGQWPELIRSSELFRVVADVERQSHLFRRLFGLLFATGRESWVYFIAPNTSSIQLFNLLTEEAIQTMKESATGERIQCIRFADDTVTLSDSLKETNRWLQLLPDSLKK